MNDLPGYFYLFVGVAIVGVLCWARKDGEE